MNEQIAVYTLIGTDSVLAALKNGGSGTLHEGRRWVSVAQQLEINTSGKIPLLLANGSKITGVEWVAVIEEIKVHESGTTVNFSNLRSISKPIPLQRLIKASDDQALDRHYRRPYVPCKLVPSIQKLIAAAISAPTNDLNTQQDVAALEIGVDPLSKEVSETTQSAPISEKIGQSGMKHYIQYHNTDNIGSRPGNRENGYSIFSSKHIRHLINQQVWLISGEGAKKKKFYLESSFKVDRIEQGQPNSAYGSNGISFDPPILLSGLTWFEDFKKAQQNFSLGVREIDEHTTKELQKLFYEQETPEDRGFRLASLVTSEQFVKALKSLIPKLTQAQKEMLLGHVNAHNHSISMGHLAALVGYSGYEAANIQYGKVGTLLAEALGIRGLSQKTQILGTASKLSNDNGHWLWTMRPELVKALIELWPLNVWQEPRELVAAAEIDADQACKDLRPTERVTLVQARIGQGIYRKSLIDLWDGRCAITGCDIGAVLIASHAKPWAACSNQERLDPFNGLLLAASIDRLFDQGLISFADDGLIMISGQFSNDQLKALNISRSSRLARVHARHKAYLKAHREHVFISI